jgi:aspartate/methionine/tyrosine aminotransferase
MRLSSAMSRLGTETAFEALARAKALMAQGRSIVNLGIGEPDLDTPAHIVAAAKEALDRGFTHYTPAAGLPEVRACIAADMARRLGFEIAPERIVVTPGAKPILFFTILALCEEGDEAIYPNPGFPIYESMIRFTGATPVAMRLRESLGFNPDPDEIDALFTSKTRLVILNSPGNPCGNVIPGETLSRIAALAADAGAVVLSDEIYKDFLYGGEHLSITRFEGMPERTVVLDGLSKSHAMTGWRVGYGVLPVPLVEPVSRLMTNSVSCTAAFAQMATIAALTGPDEPVRAMVEEFRARRDIVVAGLNGLRGVTCAEPGGAFYVFPNVTGTGMGSAEFERRILNEAGVSLLAGTSFGAQGEGYARLSFAASQNDLREALRRMEGLLGGAG